MSDDVPTVTCEQFRCLIKRQRTNNSVSHFQDIAQKHYDSCADCQKWYGDWQLIVQGSEMAAAMIEEPPGDDDDDDYTDVDEEREERRELMRLSDEELARDYPNLHGEQPE